MNFEFDSNVLSDAELLEYMIPMDGSSSGESTDESDPSVTPLDAEPVSMDCDEPNDPVRKKDSSTTPPNTCLVCGDPTKYCHYDVPSCTGCKAFFRRTVINGKSYKCKTNGKCNIKAKQRCLQCRFDKCLLVGMNPAGMKLPGTVNMAKVIERLESRKRILTNSLGDNDVTNLPPSSSKSTDSMSVVPAKMASIKLPQPMEFRDVDFLLFLETKIKKLRESVYCPKYDDSYNLQKIIESRTELSNADRYEPLGMTQWTYQQYIEDQKLMYSGMKPQRHRLRRRHWLGVHIFLSIELAKTLPVFEMLTPADKEAFIQSTTVATVILTKSYYSYERKSDAIIYPDGFVPAWLFLHHRGEMTKLEDEIFRRCMQPIERINLTKEEYVLLKAIIYCNPACNNISDAGRKLLERESEHYSRTLLRYMQSIHGAAKGASRYAQVISIMEAMAYFAKRGREFHVVKMMNKPGKPHYHYSPVTRVMHYVFEG